MCLCLKLVDALKFIVVRYRVLGRLRMAGCKWKEAWRGLYTYFKEIADRSDINKVLLVISI